MDPTEITKNSEKLSPVLTVGESFSRIVGAVTELAEAKIAYYRDHTYLFFGILLSMVFVCLTASVFVGSFLAIALAKWTMF